MKNQSKNIDRVKLVMWEDYLKTNMAEDEPSVFGTGMRSDFVMGNLIKIKGKTFAIAGKSPKKGMVMLMPVGKVTDTQEHVRCADKVTCPNCNIKMSDSFELRDYGTIMCDYCGTEYDYNEEIIVSYSSHVKNRGAAAKEVEVENG